MSDFHDEKFIKSLEEFSLQQQKDKLWQTINKEIDKATYASQDVEKTINNIKDSFKSLSDNIRRSIHTLASYFLTMAQKDLLEENGFEDYQVLSVRDERLCPKCLEMNGRHFKLKEFKIAVNAPPFHPLCRCYISPFGSESLQGTGKALVSPMPSPPLYLSDGTIITRKNAENQETFDFFMDNIYKWGFGYDSEVPYTAYYAWVRDEYSRLDKERAAREKERKNNELEAKIQGMAQKDQEIVARLKEMVAKAEASGEYLYIQYLDTAIRRMNEAGEYSEKFATADDYMNRLAEVFWEQIEKEQSDRAVQSAIMAFMWGKATNWGHGYPKNVPEPEFKGFNLEGAGKGSLKVVEGGNYSASEVKAAEYVRDLGNDVTLRPPTGTRAGGGTSDLVVNGINYDVYTPTTSNPSRIIGAIAEKNSQTTGVVLDLSKTSVSAKDLGDILSRLKGIVESGGKTLNIKDIIIMPK